MDPAGCDGSIGSWKVLLAGIGHQRLERRAQSIFGAGVAHQPPRMMVPEHEGIQLKRELFRVESLMEVPGAHGSAGGFGETVEPRTLELHQPVAYHAGLVVELDAGLYEDAAAACLARAGPGEPILEELAEAGFSGRRAKRRPHHLFGEAFCGGIDHLELKRLFGSEMRKEPALGHLEVA